MNFYLFRGFLENNWDRLRKRARLTSKGKPQEKKRKLAIRTYFKAELGTDSVFSSSISLKWQQVVRNRIDEMNVL